MKKKVMKKKKKKAEDGENGKGGRRGRRTTTRKEGMKVRLGGGRG